MTKAMVRMKFKIISAASLKLLDKKSVAKKRTMGQKRRTMNQRTMSKIRWNRSRLQGDIVAVRRVMGSLSRITV